MSVDTQGTVLDKNVFVDNPNVDLVEPMTRDEFIEIWEHDPSEIFDRASGAELSLDAYARVCAPPDEQYRTPSTIQWLLYNKGIRMTDTIFAESTPMRRFELAPTERAKDPIVRAMDAYWDECYHRTLWTGERNASSVSTLTSGGPWRPIYDETPVRTPEIAPGFNFLDAVGLVRRIAEDTYRIPERKNARGEQAMQVVAEGTPPRLMELTRGDRSTKLLEYRAGVEATDSFLNDSQTRASDITNAVEEIAIGHRITLLQQLGKVIVDNLPSGNAGTAATVAGYGHTANRLEFPQWRKHLTDFGDGYRPNITIGTPDAILGLELMPITADNNITFGSWAMVPGSSVRNLNGDATAMDYGSIDDKTTTGFEDRHIYTFQKEITLAYVQRLSMNQDEVQRVPDERKVRRWLGAQAAIACLDPQAIRSLDYS